MSWLLRGLPVAILLIWGFCLWRARGIRDTGHLGSVDSDEARLLGRRPASPLPLLPETQPPDAGIDTAIACSGGGIRAAAFAMGGLQRLQDPGAAPSESSIYDGCERVYGVSGGSYIATAMHVAQRCSDTGVGSPRLFAPDSPEADWLRRKSTYLLPSRKAWFRGLYSLAYGLAVNLAMVGALLLLVAAYTVWALRAAHAVPTGLDAAYAVSVHGELAIHSRPIVSTLTIAALIVGAGWLLFAKTLSKFTRNELSTLMWTTIGFSGALATFILFVAAPTLIVVAHNAAATNQPTTQVAGLIKDVGLVSDDTCDNATQVQFVREARLAWLRSPSPEDADSLPFSYGACGAVFHDDALTFPSFARTGVKPIISCPGPEDPASTYMAPLPDYCSPARDATGGWGAKLLAFLALVTTLTTVVRGMTAQSDSTGGSRIGRFTRLVRQYVVPWIGLTLVVVAATMVLLRTLSHLLAHPGDLDKTAFGFLPVAWLPALVFPVLRLLSDAMVSSLHPFYRERLTETFFVKRAGGYIEPVTDPDELRVDRHEKPNRPSLAVLCVANIQDIDYIPAQRGCVTFRFDTRSAMRSGTDRAYIGITDKRLPNIRQESLTARQYSLAADPEGKDTTLAAAVAASGAAFSPIIGRLSRRLRPYRILLTLANARLGVWLPNPYLVAVRNQSSPIPSPDPLSHARLRRTLNPGAFRILKEAFGRQSIYDSYLYVTDGGHFDNTGMVEALRDRPRQLIVLDASADAADSLDALADAITTARMDLNLLIRAEPQGTHRQLLTPRATEAEPQPRPERPWVHLKAVSLAPDDDYVCHIYFVKNVLSKGWDLELDAYRRDHPEFPITTTVNQFYGEYDFEAYRQLGWRNVSMMLEG